MKLLFKDDSSEFFKITAVIRCLHHFNERRMTDN